MKCEAGFLLIACLVAVLGETVVHAVEAFYVSFVNVCMSLFSEVMMFEQVVCLWIVLSSCFLHHRLEASKRSSGLLQLDMLFNLPTLCHNIN